MPPDTTRAQRRLERQRGAAKRDVQDTSGFDIVIPGQDDGPLEPRQSGRSRKTPELLPPQRSSRRTPVAKTLPLQRSTRRTPVPNAKNTLSQSPRIAPGSSLRRPHSGQAAPASAVIGKRKRPAGEEIFDMPGSPLLEAVVEEIVGEAIAMTPPVDDANHHGGEPDAEGDMGAGDIVESMQADEPAVQKTGMKKRKKRKSIGQQATRRAKAKVSPIQKRAVSEVKPESTSPSPRSEGLSRLEVFPAAVEDPAEAQIQHELAGAAERGTRDSLMGDTADESPQQVAEGKKSKPRQGHNTHARLPKRSKISDQSDPATDPHLYSIPMSVPTAEVYDHPENQAEEEEPGGSQDDHDDDDDQDNEPEEEDQDETDAEYRNVKAAPLTDHKTPIPHKPKRKKRKSIGQQRPKRPSTSHSATHRSPPITKTINRPTSAKPSAIPPPKPQHTNFRAPPSNSIPITIYRPAPRSTSPSSTPAPPTTLTAPDVLSQLIRELCTKTATNPSLSTRAQRTIALYGQELEARMKQLGQAVATNKRLGARLREVRKEERRVRGEVEGCEGEVRGVRERVGEARGVERGVRLGTLMGGLGERIRRGWAWERGREGGG